MLFSIARPRDQIWKTFFESLPPLKQDIFYSPSFAKVCQRTINNEDEVLCAIFSRESEVALYPFVKRNIARISGFDNCNGYFDITSLYGRGGIVSTFKSSMDMAPFYVMFSEYCHENSIICGFDRFHPIIKNELISMPGEQIIDIGGFVVVDLMKDMIEIESDFKSSVRKDIRKAMRNGITCFSEGSTDHLMVFLDIYYDTMVRNEARDFYYFNKEYFLEMQAEMQGQFRYFYALDGEEIISCELVLYHGRYCHSFLGGTKRKALPLAANPMLKLEIIQFYKKLGCDYFMLGGGSAPEDGIFNFKKAYAPSGVYSSFIGGTVWDQGAYDWLRHSMKHSGFKLSTNRFQFYDNN